MITRDITLEDCILDLLDNCIDGARASIRRRDGTDSQVGGDQPYVGFHAQLNFDETLFELTDNCGGMSLDDAINYAFRFGRRLNTDSALGGIGLYGIGLKRAVFKMGRDITIRSKQGSVQFMVPINVDQWLQRPEWDFDLDASTAMTDDGTIIHVKDLNDEIAKSFSDRVFKTHLTRTIARDYAFILQKGFRVSINGQDVQPFAFKVVEQGSFLPERREYQVGGVHVIITAGMTDAPPDDVGPDDEALRKVDYYGWFVTCNDRIVLAANKTERTIWGRDNFPAWHSQYNGFMGIVEFHADNPGLLPWTTTKREVDIDAPLYKDAVSQMRAATRPYIAYTNARKENLEEAKEAEAVAFQVGARPIAQVAIRQTPVYPILSKPTRSLTTVQYKVSPALISQVADALGNRHLAATHVGKQTFNYFVERELGPSAVEE